MPSIRQIHIALELWGGIFCLIAAFCTWIERKSSIKGKTNLVSLQVINAVLLFSDSFAWIFRGRETTLGYYMVRVSNFLVFSLGYALVIAFSSYVDTVCELKGRQKKILYFVNISAVILFGILIISQFTHIYYDFDIHNCYYRKNMFWISQITGIIEELIIAVIIILNRKKLGTFKYIALLSYVILPIVAMIIQIFVYGIAMLNMAVTISILLLFAQSLYEQSNYMVEQERELNNTKIQIMMSQIQPHFIFNSLTTIKHLCRKNQAEAIETIDEFAAYLRGSIDSLNHNTCIEFEDEIELVKNYLYMEKKRFQDKLNVVYDINVVGFLVPPLSIQPLVENAVKYGIRGKKSGGTITISSNEDKERYIIKVTDDGVGFDLHKDKNDGKVHVGIKNTETRVKLMCNGSLKIISEEGKGTEVIITIPKKQK